jgi:hypothetical protein
LEELHQELNKMPSAQEDPEYKNTIDTARLEQKDLKTSTLISASNLNKES